MRKTRFREGDLWRDSSLDGRSDPGRIAVDYLIINLSICLFGRPHSFDLPYGRLGRHCTSLPNVYFADEIAR